jgi:peptide chain release factor 1
MHEESFLDKLKDIEKKYEELVEELNVYKNIGDKGYASLTKQISDLEPIVECIKAYKKVQNEIVETIALINSETDKEIINIANQEREDLIHERTEIENQIKSYLIPQQSEDFKNAIIEIRSGTGGGEAGLFAQELFMMYQKYALSQRWVFEILSLKDTEVGGVREASALIQGKDVFAKLKFESGVHRVQRVPQTESSGRIHTSAATVAVLPEAEATDVKLDDKDLRIETCRSSGAGGQHVNTTDSAVKITHIPTGMTVVQQGRSQHRNKANGLNILRSKILDMEVQKKQKERTEQRKSQIGSGDRSEKIRTYNFPQDRVTDHRVSLTIHNIEKIIKEGQISEFINALQIAYKTELLKNFETTK